MAKVHFEAGPFGLGACGEDNVDTTIITVEVTCKRCKATAHYKARLYSHNKARSAPNKADRIRGRGVR